MSRKIWLQTSVMLALFAIAALVAAAIWNAVVDLPRWTQNGHSVDDIGMVAAQGIKTAGIDTMFFFVSAPLALVLGAACMFLRRHTPLLTIVSLAFASLVAAALMERFGLWIGPPDPVSVLGHAAIGTSAPQQLQVQATGVVLAWPAATMLGALLVLLVLPSEQPPAVELATR